MSRAELAEAVNDHLWRTTGKRHALDAHAIARYERGKVGWPSAPYRAGLKVVLGVGQDSDLGFQPTRRGESVHRPAGGAGSGVEKSSEGDPPNVEDPLTLASLAGRLDTDMDRRTILRLAAVAAATPVMQVGDFASRLEHALNRPVGITEDIVHQLHLRSVGFHRLESVLPAHRLLSGLLRHLEEVTRLLASCANDALRERLAATAGDSAALAAWLAWEQGDESQASALRRVARRAAQEGDDPAVLACCTIYASFAESSPARSRQRLAESRASLPRELAPATWAWLLAREAEEAAALRDPKALDMIDEAVENLSGARPWAERSWTRCLVDPRLSHMRVLIAGRLGEEQAMAEPMEELLAAAGDPAYKSTGRKLATGALGFALHGDHKEAVHYGGRAVAAVRQSEATYALGRLDELGQALARPSRSHRPVRELREEIGATRRELTGSPRPAT